MRAGHHQHLAPFRSISPASVPIRLHQAASDKRRRPYPSRTGYRPSQGPQYVPLYRPRFCACSCPSVMVRVANFPPCSLRRRLSLALPVSIFFPPSASSGAGDLLSTSHTHTHIAHARTHVTPHPPTVALPDSHSSFLLLTRPSTLLLDPLDGLELAASL